MAEIRIGGDPSSYMQAPTISAGGGKKGGGGIIATVLDLLGIHQQVARTPKGDQKGDQKGGQKPPVPPATPPAGAPPADAAMLPSLIQAESAFQPQPGLPADWGKRFIQGLRTIEPLDPNTLL